MYVSTSRLPILQLQGIRAGKQPTRRLAHGLPGSRLSPQLPGAAPVSQGLSKDWPFLSAGIPVPDSTANLE